MQLFLLHFAGGSSYSYDFLRKHIDKEVEFLPLELPGRGKRLRENALKHKEAAVQDYVKAIKKARNGQPYLIYGHSMGATLGVSVAARMQATGDFPVALVVSGNPGPGAGRLDKEGNELSRKVLSRMADAEFKEELERLGGMPREVLENKEMFDFFNPIMRADFEILEKESKFEEGICLQIPVYAMMGSEEKTSHHITNWARFTTASFQHCILPGNHFFIQQHPRALSTVISLCFEAQYQH